MLKGGEESLIYQWFSMEVRYLIQELDLGGGGFMLAANLLL